MSESPISIRDFINWSYRRMIDKAECPYKKEPGTIKNYCFAQFGDSQCKECYMEGHKPGG